MKTSLLFTFFVSCTTFTFAQISAPTGLAAKSNVDALMKGQMYVRFDDRYEGTKGSPFLFEEYSKSTVLMDTKSLFEGIDLKYNVYENNFVYLSADGTPLVVDAQYVDYIELVHPVLKNTYRLTKLEGVAAYEPKDANRLFLFIYNGEKLKLAMLPGKELVKANYKGDTYSSGRTFDEFVSKKTYYLKASNGSIEKVKLNKKSLLSALADKEGEIKSFMSKEKIDATTEEGWMKVLAYYDKL